MCTDLTKSCIKRKQKLKENEMGTCWGSWSRCAANHFLWPVSLAWPLSWNWSDSNYICVLENFLSAYFRLESAVPIRKIRYRRTIAQTHFTFKVLIKMCFLWWNTQSLASSAARNLVHIYKYPCRRTVHNLWIRNPFQCCNGYINVTSNNQIKAAVN